MPHSTVDFIWRKPRPAGQFQTGVCLHGHTQYSEECLSFLPRYLHQSPGVSQILRGFERGGKSVDFGRAFWTPPLSPAAALRLERKQIEEIGMRPLVSLTDHDNLEAPLSLHVTADPAEVPVSVEWTVPYERSILHLGIHNLPPVSARQWMSVLQAYTAAPDERMLSGLLGELARIPEVLIVLNHPFWLEEGVEEADHQRALQRVLRESVEWLHAFELNGTRPWEENRRVMELARTHARPVISGGDRHACEPAACLNLTSARIFSEFVGEIRAGYSSVWFLHQYREAMAPRVLEAARDILRPYPEFPGRTRWTDRIFYRGDDGVARPLSEVWKERVPWVLRAATGLLQASATSGLRPAVRLFLVAHRGEILP